MPGTLRAVGTVEAITTVEVRAQVAGQLREVHFTPGQEVRKDQLLFTIDPGPFEAAVRQAEAVLARDTAQANDARAQRSRLESLLSRGLIPREQFETQTANVAALEATMAADQAQVDQARLNLKYARITAPIAGRTGALMSHAGDLVRVNDTNPLVTINQLSPIYVTFSVPARLLTDIRRYQSRGPLTVAATAQSAAPRGGQAGTAPTNDGGSGGEGTLAAARTADSAQTAQGQVSFIDNAVDPTTATIKLKGTFANIDRSLWPGLFVQVALQLSSQPDAVVVPAIAVQTSQQGQYVYVVKQDHTVEMRNVTVDRQQGDQAVIARGLSGGEEVVTDGQLRLTPGAHVTAAPAERPS